MAAQNAQSRTALEGPAVRQEDGSAPLYDSDLEPEACGRDIEQNVLHGRTAVDGTWTAAPLPRDVTVVGSGTDLLSTAKGSEEWQEVINSPASKPGA